MYYGNPYKVMYNYVMLASVMSSLHCFWLVHEVHRRRNWGGGARALPIFYSRDLLIFIHAAQIAAIVAYIMFAPQKM